MGGAGEGLGAGFRTKEVGTYAETGGRERQGRDRELGQGSKRGPSDWGAHSDRPGGYRSGKGMWNSGMKGISGGRRH